MIASRIVSARAIRPVSIALVIVIANVSATVSVTVNVYVIRIAHLTAFPCGSVSRAIATVCQTNDKIILK